MQYTTLPLLLMTALIWFHRVQSVEALGRGSTAHLIALAQQQTSTPAQSVLSAAALAADSSADTKGSSHYLSQASILEDARKCLLKAPLLCELHECTSWRLLFEAELGSLFDFVQGQGIEHYNAPWQAAVMNMQSF